VTRHRFLRLWSAVTRHRFNSGIVMPHSILSAASAAHCFGVR
jgi:hypothetical protein